MNSFGAYKKILVVCGSWVVMLLLCSIVHAATSTNFIVSQDGSGPTEGDSASANFLLKWKIGIPSAGQLNSGSYVVDVGTRWFEPAPIPPVVPTPTPPTPPTVGPSPTVPVPVAVTTTPTTTATTTTPTPSTTPTGTTTPNPPSGIGSTSTPPNPPVSTGSSTTLPITRPPTSSSGSSTTLPTSLGGTTSTPPPTLGTSSSTTPTLGSAPTVNDYVQPNTAPAVKRTPTTVGPVKKPNTVRSWGEKMRGALGKIIPNFPAVAEQTANILNPTLAALAVTTLALQVPAAGFLSLLHFLFLQPLLLFGYGRRAKAGQVYNALNKAPIDLALVRLIDVKNNRIVQSRVTDKNGLFYFHVAPGVYRIEVVKEQMIFPSQLLAGRNVDGRKANIYHGENIEVVDSYPLITPNIPLDPIVVDKPFTRLIWETWARRLQVALAFSGVLLVILTIALTAGSWYLYGLLCLHIALFIIFRRLAMPPKPKGWGIVYDSSDKKPLGRTVARLFNTEFNKLVATQITDPHGRYYFLAGDSKYQVRFERKDYETATSKQLDLSGKEMETIDLEVPLKKNDSSENDTAATGL